MTVINDDLRREDYVATASQTIFPYSFTVLNSNEIDVYVDGALQSSGYTVTGVDDPDGGNVTFDTAMTGGEGIIILGEKAYERTVEFDTAQEILLANELNDGLAAQTILSQQLSRDQMRMLRAPVIDVGPDFELPAATSRAGKLLGFADPSGDPEMLLISDVAPSALTQSVIANLLWPPSALEIAYDGTGAVAINRHYWYGHVLRYANNLTPGTTDMTAAFNTALAVGHPVIYDVPENINIEGTVSLSGDQSVTLCAGADFQRFAGDETTPLIHLYGNRNTFDVNGADIRQDLYAYPSGIVLIGPSLDEIESGPTDVQCYDNVFRNFKIIGPENNPAAAAGSKDNGHPALLVHSLRRKKFTVANPTYDNLIQDGYIVNGDRGLELSTDVNRSVFSNIKILQYKTHAISAAAAYGNIFSGVRWEAPLAWTGGSPRYSVALKGQNYGAEADTDATYAITEAYNNWFYGYCELASGDGRLMDWDAITTTGGYNRFFGPFSCSDGFGKDATSGLSGLGTNRLEANTFSAAPGVLHKFGGEHRFEPVDDLSGGIHSCEGYLQAVIRKANMDEGTHYERLVWDNFGGAGASIDESALVTIRYGAKASQNSLTMAGFMIWHLSIENNVVQAPDLVFHVPPSRNEDKVVQPVINESAGTATNTGKFTFAFETLPVAGVTTVNYAFMDIQIAASPLFPTNLDWAADITFVDTTYATAAQALETKKIRDHDGNMQLDDRQAALTVGPSVVIGSAGVTYSSTTQNLIDDLVTAVNLLITNDIEKATLCETHGLAAPNAD